jgi:hypothetical protein
MDARVRVGPSLSFPAVGGRSRSRRRDHRSPAPCQPPPEGGLVLVLITEARPRSCPSLSSSWAGGAWAAAARAAKRGRHTGRGARAARMGRIGGGARTTCSGAWVSPRKNEEDGGKEKMK